MKNHNWNLGVALLLTALFLVAELFEYTRDVEDGEIRVLVVRHGLPFTMEIELSGRAARQAGGDRA